MPSGPRARAADGLQPTHGVNVDGTGASAPAHERPGVSILEHSSARLAVAHAFADLGRELSRKGQRRERRGAQRKAMELAQDCGAIALALSARSELQAGPGRRLDLN